MRVVEEQFLSREGVWRQFALLEGAFGVEKAHVLFTAGGGLTNDSVDPAVGSKLKRVQVSRLCEMLSRTFKLLHG